MRDNWNDAACAAADAASTAAGIVLLPAERPDITTGEGPIDERPAARHGSLTPLDDRLWTRAE